MVDIFCKCFNLGVERVALQLILALELPGVSLVHGQAALTDEDTKILWLPLILYDNTDQKEATRLGENWEWMTSVTISREGDFTRSGPGEVDEAEIFEGGENSLTMNQTYTWEFQCKYELQRYPFDTQVKTFTKYINHISRNAE
jgi:hypothetical protein